MRTGRRTAEHALGALGVLLAVLAIRNYYVHWQDRYPRQPWGRAESIYSPVIAASCIALAVCGPWMMHRARHNPTGARITWLGVCFSGWIAATYWESDVGQWINWFLPVTFRPLLFVAVLAWPTGRFDPIWTRRVRWLIVVYAVLTVGITFLGEYGIDMWTPWGWDEWPIPGWGSDGFATVTSRVVLLVTVGLIPAAVLVALVRLRRQPGGRQRIDGYAFAAGVVAVLGDLWLVAVDYLGQELEWANNSFTSLGIARTVIDYGRFGVVPILLVVALERRIRAVRLAGDRQLVVDLEDELSSSSAEEAVPSITGDPSARLVWRRGESWIDAAGVDVPAMSERVIEAIADRSGALFAGVEHAANLDVSPAALESVAARLRLQLLVGTRTAQAAARLNELRTMQRALIAAQDDARRRVERDLHDGAQQRLVALGLQAAMAQRANGAAHGVLADDIDAAADDLVAAPLSHTPAALADGLAVGLHTLAATAAVPVDVIVQRDAPVSDASVTAWFVAADALANALKHASATRIVIRLSADDDDVRLSISDDGVGGVDVPPRSIAARVTAVGGTVTVRSTRGSGTTIDVVVPLGRQAVPA
jgi:signal transduction histidine kinase